MTPRTAVLDRLLAITMLFDRDMRHSLEGTGLTAARVRLLWELHRHGPSTQQTLARALDVSPRNVTGLVDTLVDLGYVTRNPHPTDRRAALVTFTDLGARTMEQMAGQYRQLADDLTADLSNAEVTDLRATLARIEATFQTLIEAEERRRHA